MVQARFLRNADVTGLSKRLIFPLCLALLVSAGLWFALSAFDFLALAGLTVVVGFLSFSLAFRRFERLLFGMIFMLVPVNVDVNFGPSLYALGLPEGTILFNISAIDLLVLALYPMWILRVLNNRSRERVIWPAGGVPLLLFAAWGALTMLNAPNKVLTALEAGCLIKSFFVYFYLANNVRTKEDVWFAVKCLMAGLLFECMIGGVEQVLQHNIGLGFLGERKAEKMVNMSVEGDSVFRIGGTLGHPTFLGGYLAAMLPVSLATVLQPYKGIRRLLALGIFLFAGMILVFSYCRSAWIVTAVSLPLMVLRWYREYLKTHKFSPVPIVILAFLGLCITAPLIPKISTRLTADDKGSTESRIPQWKLGFNMFKAHPIMGVGMNNYNVVSEIYEPYVADPSTPGRVFVYYSKLHNVYLSVAAQMGIVGAFLYVLCLRNILWYGWKRLKATADASVRTLYAGMLLGLAALLTHEGFHTGNIAGNMMLWTMGACLAGPVYKSMITTSSGVSA